MGDGGQRARGGVWACGTTAALLFAVLAVYLAPLEPGALALQFAFTPRAFGAVVHAWSPADLARYRSHLPVDFVLLLLYGAFGVLLATRTRLFAPLPAQWHRAAAWLAPLAASFDAAENAWHLWLTEAPRFGVPLAYAASAACSSLKWLLLAAFALTCLLALARSRR